MFYVQVYEKPPAEVASVMNQEGRSQLDKSVTASL